jgi:hypothetical protein
MKGTTTERGPGVWRLRVLTGYTPEGRPVQRSKTVQGTKRAAQTELAKFVAEAQGGQVPVAAPATLRRYVTELYLPHVRANLSPETYRNHASKLGGRVMRDLGHVRPDKLTAHHLDTAYRRWKAEGLATSTVRAHHMVIPSALTQAVKWGMVTCSVAPFGDAPVRREARADAPYPRPNRQNGRCHKGKRPCHLGRHDAGRADWLPPR